MNGRRRLASIGVLVALIVLIPMTAMALASAPVVRMGDQVASRGWTYRVVSFERLADPLPDDSPALTTDVSDVLGVIVLDAWNDTAYAASVDLGQVALIDSSGRVATAIIDPAPVNYLNESDFSLATAVISSGGSARIALFFSIDPSWSFPTLRLAHEPAANVRIDECHCALPLPWLDTQ
jgi:hypothetical protein